MFVLHSVTTNKGYLTAPFGHPFRIQPPFHELGFLRFQSIAGPSRVLSIPDLKADNVPGSSASLDEDWEEIHYTQLLGEADTLKMVVFDPTIDPKGPTSGGDKSHEQIFQ